MDYPLNQVLQLGKLNRSKLITAKVSQASPLALVLTPSKAQSALHPSKNPIKVFCAYSLNAFCASLLFWGNLVFAQQICDQAVTDIPLHIQADERGWVFDYRARLQWQRCAIGQTWVNQQCVGKAEAMTYFQAVNTVTELNRQSSDGFNDWKIPHLKDLAFIAEQHCRNPRVRLELFPNFPLVFFGAVTHASSMTLTRMCSPWILASLVLL